MATRRRTTSSKTRGSRKKTATSLRGYNKKNPNGAKLLAQAMENGIIVRFDTLEFPIWMNPSAFAGDLVPEFQEKQQKKKKGGKNFDMKEFMRDNNRKKKTSKATLKKELKKSIENMNLTYYTLAKGVDTVKGKIKGKDRRGVKRNFYMSPKLPIQKHAGPFYKVWKQAYDAQMEKFKTTPQKDAALAKAYAQAVLDLAPYSSDMSKKLKDNPQWHREFKLLAKINPLDAGKGKQSSSKSKSSSKKSTKTKQTKQTKMDTSPLSAAKVSRLAKEYNKGGARGKYGKMKALYGVRNANKIKIAAAKLREASQKKPKQQKKSTRTSRKSKK